MPRTQQGPPSRRPARDINYAAFLRPSPQPPAPTLSRIFLVLAAVSLTLLATNLFVGLTIGDLQQVARDRKQASDRVAKLRQERRPDSALEMVAAREQSTRVFVDTAPTSRRVALHILLGVLAALVVVLVNSISVTYFIGTSRWCREVVETYSLPTNYIDRSKRIKRRSFPWSLGAMLVIVGTIALGAASDPGASAKNSAAFVTPHLLAALAGTAFIAWSFLMQFGKMSENHALIGEVMADVTRIRKARGLHED